MGEQSRVHGVTPTPKPTAPRSELGDFLVVTRRALMVICSYVEKRYGTDEPRYIRADRDDEKQRAA